MEFTSFKVKLEVLRNTKNLAGSQIRVDVDEDKEDEEFDSIHKVC